MSDQSSLAAEPKNSFLRGSIRSVFIRTSLPIIVVTTISGLLTVVDAMLLGAFVGADVGIGMASILGRRLGAKYMGGAINTLASAQGLPLLPLHWQC